MENKKKFINSFKDGESINDIFLVKFKKGIKRYKNKEGFYFNLTLSDNSGNIEYTFWGDNQEEKIRNLYNSIKPDSIVKIAGQVSLFNGRKQLTSNNYENITLLKDGEYDKKDFLNPPRKNTQELYEKLLSTIKEVTNPMIKKLLENIFNDSLISRDFKIMPGGIEIHHNWVGGLLEHTLEVLEHSLITYKQFPELNKDLLIAGSLLHDIGKLEELKITTRIKGTTKGQLLGHIVLGSIFVSKKCDEIGMDADTKNKLLHLIVSHHGKEEFGSPKAPMFPEALVIYYSDELSSKIAELIEFTKKAREETEDNTMYYRRGSRNILLR